MTTQYIASMLFRNGFAIAIVTLAAGMLSYHLIRDNPGYIDSAGVAFTAPNNSVAMFQNMKGLLAVEDTVATYMVGPQAEQKIHAAGGTAPYDVALLNLYNEQYPNYSQPYVTITVMSHYPELARQTFDAVLGVLRQATAMLQEQVGATSKNEVKVTLVAEPTGPIAQGGSHRRSYAAMAVLTIIAIYNTAGILDRRRPRRPRKHGRNSRVAARSGMATSG